MTANEKMLKLADAKWTNFTSTIMMSVYQKETCEYTVEQGALILDAYFDARVKPVPQTDPAAAKVAIRSYKKRFR